MRDSDFPSFDRVRNTRAASLELSDAAMGDLAEQTLALVLDYFARVAELPVFPDTSAGITLRRLGAELPEVGEPIQKLLNDCRAMFDASRHNGHPRFFGYVASPATAPGAFADLIGSALNANVTSWRSGPAATEVERLVVRWLGSLTGFSEDACGLLTSGGSMANLTALFIAQRAKAVGDPAHTGLWKSATPMTMYASDQVHMSIPKAADVLGLGRDQLRVIASDAGFRLDVRALRERIREDAAKNFKPFCIVANAGSVNTGAVDNLDQIAAVAQEFGLWFHVDGAYGALAAMDQTKRPLFRGIELADSLSLDCHKWLYTPLDAGCLLFRDDFAARAAFGADEADYIKIHEHSADESFAFWDRGIELSRRFRALKIWLTLRYFGSQKIAAAISEDISLAQYLAQQVTAAADFQLLAPVELSICCFRYLPASMRAKLESASEEEAVRQIDSELDELNTRIMHAVQRGGEAYISSATVKGKFALRACITNFRTTRDDIDALLDIVREVARQPGSAI